MKKLIYLTLSISALSMLPFATEGYGQDIHTDRSTQETDQVYESRTVEKVGTRSEIQYQQEDTQAQMEQAKRNIKIDERNIQKAEAKKESDENQVEVDKKTVKKYKAQLEEDKAYLEKLEDELKVKK